MYKRQPHNEAAQGAFAKTVLMPGDPLRAKFIAETFLQDAKLVNNVRGVQGYTGTYQGTPVSVMASGKMCIRDSVKAACKGRLLKVIIECCFLTDEEKIKMCEIVTASGAEYIKT